MATRNMAYDHAAYLVPVSYQMYSTGANATWSWCAHADLIAKSLRLHVRAVGTSADEAVTIHKVAAGTATTVFHTGALVMTGATALTAQQLLMTNTSVISAGDEIRVTFGTDASRGVAYSLESVVVPGASFTV